MASKKQVAANRRNAQLSTGPKPLEGKAAVRLNALQHGLTARDAVIFEEDREAFNGILNTFLDHLQPVGPLETALVHQIVMAQWRLARCRKLETGVYELSYVDHRQDLAAGHPDFNANEALAYLFRRSTQTIATLSRYEARAERALYRALHELQRLQAASVDITLAKRTHQVIENNGPHIGGGVDEARSPQKRTSAPCPVGQAVPPAPPPSLGLLPRPAAASVVL